MKDINVEEEINYEITWRTNEISIVKTIPFLFRFSIQQREVFEKYTIPVFYSLWEGFVVEVFSIYTRAINNLKLSKDEICVNLLVHGADIKCKLKNTRTDFDRQMLLIQEISEYLDGEILIPFGVPSESNVNYKVINSILRRYNLEVLPEKPYRKSLDKLLLYRNKISHGENSLPINQKVIDEMSLTVISAMHETANSILAGIRLKSYLKQI